MTPTTGNRKHQAAVDATRDRILELRADTRNQLRVLRSLASQLEDLADTRQAPTLGLVTDDMTAARDQQIRADRAAARGLVGRNTTTGQGWMNAATVLGVGQTAAPVAMSAVSAVAEIRFALARNIRRLGKPALLVALEEEQTLDEDHGLCRWPRDPLLTTTLDTDAGIDALIDRLTILVDRYANRPRLEQLLRDLDHLEETARDVIDGPARTNHPDPCPWCGRNSLVIHHRQDGRDTQIIRCDGRHQCRCEREHCDCHRNPIRNRHEWVNSGRAAHTWTELHNLQNKRKELTLMETKALDALERIRALHQPVWHGDNGETAPAYVYITGDQPDVLAVPADHECVTDWTSPDGATYVSGCYDAGQGVVLHAVPICTTCGDANQTGDIQDVVLWPCPTYRTTDLDTTNSPDEE